MDDKAGWGEHIAAGLMILFVILFITMLFIVPLVMKYTGVFS